MHASRMFVGTAASLVAFAGLASAATPSITEVAPKDAIVVLHIEDYAQLRTAFDNSAFGAVWSDEGIQSWIQGAMSEAMEELGDELADLGFDLEDISEPAGPVGFTVFLEGDSFDETEYAFMAMADFGDEAETMHGLVAATLEDAVEEGGATLEDEDFMGATIWTITPQVDEDMAEFFESIGEEVPAPSAAYYAKAGSGLMFSTSRAAIESAIETAEGESDAESVTANATFSETMDVIGSGDAHVVVNFEPLYELTAQLDRGRAQDPDNDPLFMLPPIGIVPVLDSTGLTEVRSMGFSVNFGTADAAMEATSVVLVPERRGLMTLIPSEPASFEPPAFVSADAASFSMFQVDFQNLLPAVQGIVSSLPAEIQQQAGMGLMMAQGALAPVLNNLGPEVYVVQTIEKPYSVDSAKSLVAINAKDSAAVAQSVSMLSAQMGVQARDFEGFQIWDVTSSPMLGQLAGPGVPEISFGLSADHLFVGESADVEGALRSINADNPALADEQSFRSAVASVPGEGLAFGWSDTQKGLEYGIWMLQNLDEIQKQQMIDMFGDDPEMLAMIEEDMEDGMPEFLKNLPDMSVVYDAFGDSVQHITLTPQGIVTKVYLYNAE